MDYLDPVRALLPGVNGAVLSVLTHTNQPLTLRQLAERAGVTHPQAARHAERLERLGIVRRQLAGRSHLLDLTESAASVWLRSLASLRDVVLAGMRESATRISPEPLSLVVFGSFARGTATADSDIDVLTVAPRARTDDLQWQNAVSEWLDSVAELAGNPVADIVVEADELPERVDEPLWRSIREEGVVLAGQRLGDLIRHGMVTGKEVRPDDGA
ncbi:nucleotidyltransferase domain-containing protein [Phytoactinopolyspora halotolerans]|uniref:Helix-turn-helix domain-containing protein n=1 Tax=Phytoactinopolyspora halotolerans TaxID=1981512 RepID=A0A6L9S533_9ACTN|nr:nucleotidyltransferase domain-containing protein [Phytoactinopolyspora halotolerans]NEE00093.1 helix-turn-helix domain-containing protein [Phytoactinopolyspora halotolerans]